MSFDVDVGPLLQLAQDFHAARGQVVDKTRLVVRKTTLDIQATGMRLCPVDTGFLRSSITSEFQGSGNFARGITGPTAEYGDYVERGTSKMGPQPYMFPAADRHEPAFVAAMEAIAEGTVA